MIRAWLVAFAFTQLVEVPIYSVGLRCRVWAAFGASALTHPLVWFVLFDPRWEASYLTKTLVAEFFAWGVETAWFAILFRKHRAWLWSLIANGASLGAGLLSRALLGAP